MLEGVFYSALDRAGCESDAVDIVFEYQLALEAEVERMRVLGGLIVLL